MNLRLALGVAYATSQLALVATTMTISPLSRMRFATVRHPDGVLVRTR